MRCGINIGTTKYVTTLNVTYGKNVSAGVDIATSDVASGCDNPQ